MIKDYPVIDKTTFIHKTAVIIGKVRIGKNCGVFPNAVIRGDENTIFIDDGTNIQDGCVLHNDYDHIVEIGKNVSIGHLAMVHGAKIEDNCIIGINSTILNGAIIKKGSIIGANALVTSGSVIPKNSLVFGVPGKVIKQDESYEKQALQNAEDYKNLVKQYKNGKFLSYSNE
jgi:carbonic anhydrase/acetyltransferase-like protein (isoleucine patch superfamily)